MLISPRPKLFVALSVMQVGAAVPAGAAEAVGATARHAAAAESAANAFTRVNRFMVVSLPDSLGQESGHAHTSGFQEPFRMSSAWQR
ncbi:hypothetical protein ABTY20_07075 [Streptomyces sp. NPDC126497]|uniref:hypothetical protein n=1 Tax=Streptomyces sp. NPDC126497 TaxID=3155313 RepID=UPI00332B5E82